MSQKRKYILGISYSHNSSACLMDYNGNIIFASSEERFSKNKNDLGIPKNTISYILKTFPKIKIDAVCVGDLLDMKCYSKEYLKYFYFDSYDKRNSIFKNNKLKFIKIIIIELINKFFFKLISPKTIFEKELRDIGLKCKVFYYNHHYSHACSAYYSNKYKNGFVLTMDGEGNGISGSFWNIKKGILKKRLIFQKESSLGISYRTITSFLRFRPNEHEGKVTGLSSYNLKDKKIVKLFKKKIYFDKKNNTIRNEISKNYFFRYGSANSRNIFSLFSFFFLIFQSKNYKDFYSDILSLSSNSIIKKLNLSYKDNIVFKKKLSYAIQNVTEKSVLDFLEFNIKSKTNLYLAGGLFANVKLNSLILNKRFIKNLFVFPGMGDEGLSIGGCYAYLIGKKKNIEKKLFSPYLGYNVNNSSTSFEFKKLKINNEKKIKFLSKSLYKNKIIGFVYGKAEFGPRALGHRSIIACPKKNIINYTLNKRLGRYEYMPFAPITIKKYFKKIFNNTNKDLENYSFMTTTTKVKKNKYKISGIIHIDKTARPQILHEKDNPLLYQLIKNYYNTYNIPCLINTSFNDHGLPIINDEEDAFNALRKSRIDLLFLNNDIFIKN